MRKALCLAALLALCLPAPAQTSPPTPAPPGVVAELTQIQTGATDATMTLTVTNQQPPSRPAATATITGNVVGFGAFTGTVTFPPLNSLYNGSVTLSVPQGFTVANLADGGAAGLPDPVTGVTLLTYPVRNLEGGAAFTTTFDLLVSSVLPATATAPATPQPTTPVAVSQPVPATPSP